MKTNLRLASDWESCRETCGNWGCCAVMTVCFEEVDRAIGDIRKALSGHGCQRHEKWGWSQERARTAIGVAAEICIQKIQRRCNEMRAVTTGKGARWTRVCRELRKMDGKVSKRICVYAWDRTYWMRASAVAIKVCTAARVKTRRGTNCTAGERGCASYGR